MKRLQICLWGMLVCAASSSHLALAAVSADAPDAAKSPVCAQSPCRTVPLRVELMAADGLHQYDATFNPVAYVQDGVITIFPGETLVFRFSGPPDRPGVPIFVREITAAVPTRPQAELLASSDAASTGQHDPKTGESVYFIHPGSPLLEGGTAAAHLKDEPPGTLIVSYHQVAGHPDMELRIEHNLPTSLKYDAEISRLGSGQDTAMQPTSTCPVPTLLATLETWPYPLATLTLRNFRPIDMTKGFNCN